MNIFKKWDTLSIVEVQKRNWWDRKVSTEKQDKVLRGADEGMGKEWGAGR